MTIAVYALLVTSCRCQPGPPGSSARRRRGNCLESDVGSNGLGIGMLLLVVSTALDSLITLSYVAAASGATWATGGSVLSESLWFTKSLSSINLVALYGLYAALRHALLLLLVMISYSHLGASISWTCAAMMWSGTLNLSALLLVAVAVGISTHSGAWFTLVLGASSQGSGLAAQCVAVVCCHTGVAGLLGLSGGIFGLSGVQGHGSQTLDGVQGSLASLRAVQIALYCSWGGLILSSYGLAKSALGQLYNAVCGALWAAWGSFVQLASIFRALLEAFLMVVLGASHSCLSPGGGDLQLMSTPSLIYNATLCCISWTLWSILGTLSHIGLWGLMWYSIVQKK